MHDVEAANDAASVVSEDIAATNGFSSSLPPFQQAIVLKDELPEMPAEVIEGVLLETHKMLLTGPSKAGKTWCLINLAVSVATGGWWIVGEDTANITLVGTDGETNYICDCKFRNGKVDSGALDMLIERSERMRGLKNKKMTLFSISGFDSELVKRAKKEGVILIGPKELLV